jgi:hypothetical protein
VLFVDEVGANTSQKQDGNIGRRKFLVARGKLPQECNAYNDCHFTVLVFTAADGAPVIFCAIIAAKTLTTFEASGINDMSEDFLENSTLEGKSTKDEYKNGFDRLFPMGSTCIFEGKDVPCFVSCHQSGSIMSHMLAIMLKRMDDLKLFSRGVSLPDPFLFLNRHGNRFDLPFLEYINNGQDKWTTCLARPMEQTRG